MVQSQENIKKIKAEGISGSNSVKVILDGNGEMEKIEISIPLCKTNGLLRNVSWSLTFTQNSRSLSII